MHPIPRFRDSVAVYGRIVLDLFDSRGRLKEHRDVKNLVVLSGKCGIASRLIGVASAVPSHIGVGSGLAATSAEQVALGAEIAKVALTSLSVTNNGLTFQATFPAGTGTGTLQEAGLFNGNAAASAGLAYTRVGTVTTVTKASHGLAVGRAIGIAGATDSGQNGGCTVASVVDPNTFTYVTAASGANGTLTLYPDVMLARQTFGVLTKAVGDVLTATWTLTIS